MSDPAWRKRSGETDEQYMRRTERMLGDFTGKLDVTPAAKPGENEKQATKDDRHN